MAQRGAQVEKLNTTLGNINKYNIINQKNKRTKEQKIFNNSFVSSVKESSKNITGKEIALCDMAIEDFNDLVDPAFKNWFCKCYYKLGDDTMRRLAGLARDPEIKSSKSYFGRIIKNELKNCS